MSVCIKEEIITKLLHFGARNEVQEFKNLLYTQEKPINWSKIVYKKSGDTVMHVAAKRGAVDILKFLKENTQCNFEQSNLEGKRPLHEAAQASQNECVQFLLSTNVLIDSLKRADWTPLMLACTKRCLPVIEDLVKSGANLKLVNKDGWTAFHIASREGDENIINYLLKENPNAWNTTSKNGRTPLHTAVMHGHMTTVNILLKTSKLHLNFPDSCGSTAFMDAARFDHVDVMQLLHEDYNADVLCSDALQQNSLHLAAQMNSLKAISYLIRKINVSPNCTTTRGETALHIAAKEGHYETICLLLKLGINSEIRDVYNRSAGCIAKSVGFTECYEVLKSHTM